MTLVHNLYKPIGLTPLEILKRYLAKTNQADRKATYVGRLDPMAHGVQIILIDPSRERVEELKGLDKTYKTKVVFGVETDTNDLLGLAKTSDANQIINKEKVLSELSRIVGTFDQPYPIYSAAKVNGQPLHYWARNGKIDSITIPTHPVTVLEAKLLEFDQISFESIVNKAEKFIPTISGDFRQDQILERWKPLLQKNKKRMLTKATIEFKCSSGTYIRQIVDQLGKDLEGSAFCLDIYRTQVGNYFIDTSVKL